MTRATPDSKIDLSGLGLDALGRAVLSDDLLAVIDEFEGPISAGGNNLHCPGPGEINHSCSNDYCDDSVNWGCTNSAACSQALNMSACKQPRDVPPD